MSEQRIDIASGVGIIGLGAGFAAAATGRAKFAMASAGAAVVAALLARRDAEEAPDLERRVSSMNEQIRQLENAVAAQVQNRMAAEEAVKSLSGQLSDAERRAGTTPDMTLLRRPARSRASVTFAAVAHSTAFT